MSDAVRSQMLRASTGLSVSQIRNRVEDGRLLHPFHDVYVSGAQARDDNTRLRALFVRLPPGSATCRQTAARLLGLGDFMPSTPGIHVVMPAGTPRPRLPGVRTFEAVLPYEPVVVDGIPCTALARTAVDLARTNPRMDGLPALDGALRAGCTEEELLVEIDRHSRLRGVCRARQLMSIADAGAQCRQESQLRLIAVDGGMPRPTTQFRIVDDFGYVRFYLDLAWERFRLAAEYDGRSHASQDRVRHDRDRHNWLAAHRWEMRYFTDVDLYRRPSYIASTLRAAIR